MEQEATEDYTYFRTFCLTGACQIGCSDLADVEGREHNYIVQPTGDWFHDPNFTENKFPGNPTRSSRSRSPLRIAGEVENWTPHAPDVLAAMKDNLAKLKAEGRDVIID